MTNTSDTFRHCDLLRRAFRRLVVEDNLEEMDWREEATKMVWALTGFEKVDPILLNWIIEKRHTLY